MFLFFYSAFDLVCQLIIALAGLTLCFVGGFGLKSIDKTPPREALTCLVFGSAMTGTSGGALEQWIQIVLLKQQPHPTTTTQILLVLGVIIYAEIGMYCGRLALKRNLVLIQGQEPAT